MVTAQDFQRGGLNTPEALEKVCGLFNRNLLSNAPAMEYLKERGITEDIVRRGDVGFCPPYYDHWFDLLRGRITVTIRDVHGNIVAFAGRQYDAMKTLTERAFWNAYSNAPAKAQKRIDHWARGKWINEPYSKSRHLFQLDEAKPYIRERNYAVIVEGYFDARVMFAYGLENTGATCGVALSDYHIALLSRYCDHIVFLLDGDSAGEKAVTKMMPLVLEADLKAHAVYLPSQMDPDEFLLKYKGRALRNGIEKMIAENKEELRIKVRES